jgi:molybdenum cofactor synthesis domain-containing protein
VFFSVSVRFERSIDIGRHAFYSAASCEVYLVESPSRTAALLLIGNELLTGKIADQNFSWLAKELYSLGVSLRRVLVIPDELTEIAEAVRTLSTSYDVVITSGGVGPTHDDVTIAGVAAAFGVSVVSMPSLEAEIREYFQQRLTESHLRMALVPEGAALLSYPDLRWPNLLVRNVYILPGVPELFRLKFSAMRERFRSTPFFLAEIWLSCEEGLLAAPLEATLAQHPHVQLGSYPRFDAEADHKVKLTLEAKDKGEVEAALKTLLALVPQESMLRFCEARPPLAPDVV